MAKKISAAFAIIIIAAFAIFVGFMSWIWCNYDNLEVYNNTMSRSYQKERKNCIREGEGISTMPLPNGAKNPICCEGLSVIPIEKNVADAGYCTKCGDKLCKKPEDSSNCPTDCAGGIVGNDRDEHDCIGSAGYTWCEEKQKCLRSWEESCGGLEKITKENGNLEIYTSSYYGYIISYPSEFSVYGGNTLANYDINDQKYIRGNPKGINIQINKFSLIDDSDYKSFNELINEKKKEKSDMVNPGEDIKLGGYIILQQYTKDGPGGAFMSYFAYKEGSDNYFGILVFEPGYSKNKNKTEEILKTFKIL